MAKQQHGGFVWPDAQVVMKQVDELMERFDLAIRDAYNLYFHCDCNLPAAIAWQEAHIKRQVFGQTTH